MYLLNWYPFFSLFLSLSACSVFLLAARTTRFFVCLEFSADHWSSFLLPEAPALRVLQYTYLSPCSVCSLRLFHVSHLSLSLLITCCMLLMTMCFYLLFSLPFACSVTPLHFCPLLAPDLLICLLFPYFHKFLRTCYIFLPAQSSVVNALPAANFCLHFLPCLPGGLVACQAFMCFYTCHTHICYCIN